MPVGIRAGGCIAWSRIWAGARPHAVNTIPETRLAGRLLVTFKLALTARDAGDQLVPSTRVLWMELDVPLQNVTIGRISDASVGQSPAAHNPPAL